MPDREAVHRHFKDPLVHRFLDLDDGELKDVEGAEKIIRFHRDDAGCRWGIYCKKTLQLMGTCGFHCLREKPCFCAEIGYDLAKRYWGQGLMREVLEVVIHYGFDPMGLQKIEATVDPENHRSIKLLETMNFVRDDAMHGDLVYYSKTIAEAE